jgi:pimeloyl-ACP methyl ester carboxylesterase
MQQMLFPFKKKEALPGMDDRARGRWNVRSYFVRILRFSAAIGTFLFVCFYAFAETNAEIECSHPSLPEGLAAMSSTNAVLVKTIKVDVWPGSKPAPEDDNMYFSFEPRYKVPTTGLIIHPGGNCDPRAYAPMAQAIAAKGYLVAIIPMPNCLSLNGWDRTAKVIEDYGGIKTWVLAGHSMGGATICVYAHEYGGIAGLILLAGLGYPDYPLDTTYNIKVLSLYGENDAHLTPAMVMDPQYTVALPSDTTYVELAGANHTQFGWLDPTPNPYYFKGDGPATITYQEQQDIVVQYTLDFLKSLADKPQCPVVSLLGNQSKQVISLRRFRDQMLAKSTAGQNLIEYYYLYADAITNIFDSHPIVRGSAKKALELLVPMMDKLFRLE